MITSADWQERRDVILDDWNAARVSPQSVNRNLDVAALELYLSWITGKQQRAADAERRNRPKTPAGRLLAKLMGD